MPADIARKLIKDYELNTWVALDLVEGLTHEESLIPLPMETNCLNWVFGHIVTNRSHVLEVLDVEHAWQKEVRERHHTGTEAIKRDKKYIRFETLVGYLKESMELLKPALETISEETLSGRFTNYRGEKTRQEHLTGFHWHETYHIGQLEIFKDIALARREEG